MSDHSITSLIEKLEGADVGSRELDCAVARVLDCYKGFATEHLTTSLDAALALAERVLPKLARMEIKTYAQGKFHHCTIETDDDEFDSDNCRTPALALCASILRAQSEARV